MKKLIIVLMVVAMASFLFVGCLPGVTPEPEPEPTVPTIKTDTPIITEISGIDLSLTAESTNAIKVTGYAPIGSVIKVYLNDVQTGIGYAGVDGLFSAVSGTSMATILGGAKTLYVTATQFGLAESAHSVSYSFTYDITAPKIASATADSDDAYITVTFNEGVKATLEPTEAEYDAATETAEKLMKAAWAMSALNSKNWTVFAGTLTAVDVEDTDLIAVSTTTIRILTADAIDHGGEFFSVTCTGIGDLQGNTIKVTAPATFGGTIAP